MNVDQKDVFSAKLLFHLQVGQAIIIGGKIKPGADRVEINLAASLSDNDNIPLHFSIRFPENIVVRNTKTKGIGWGREEREENRSHHSHANPFIRGEKFKLMIHVRGDGFHVDVNGKNYCVYRHRLNVHDVRAIWVSKDVEYINQFDMKMM